MKRTTHYDDCRHCGGERGEKIVGELHGLSGFDAWAERIAKEIAAERERARNAEETILDLHAEIERLRRIESAARALKFSAYPAHGSGFVMQVSDGNINDLESALTDAK